MNPQKHFMADWSSLSTSPTRKRSKNFQQLFVLGEWQIRRKICKHWEVGMKSPVIWLQKFSQGQLSGFFMYPTKSLVICPHLKWKSNWSSDAISSLIRLFWNLRCAYFHSIFCCFSRFYFFPNKIGQFQKIRHISIASEFSGNKTGLYRSIPWFPTDR